MQRPGLLQRRSRAGSYCLIGALLLFGGLGCSGEMSFEGKDGTMLNPDQVPDGTPIDLDGDGKPDIKDPKDDPTPQPGFTCAPEEISPESAPMRRLTVTEYHYTLQDLLPALQIAEQELVADTPTGGFDNVAAGQSVSPLLVEQYVKAAQNVAQIAVDDQSWLPCEKADGESCLQQAITDLAAQAWRRPLEADEQQRLSAFLSSAHSSHGFDDALRMGLEAILETPQFLYRPEFGSGEMSGQGLVALNDWEMATRLSYFLWRTMPDDELRRAAAAGELSKEAGLRMQIDRMLQDDRAKRGIGAFFAQWLDMEKISTVDLDAEKFPELDNNMREDLLRSTEMLVEHLFWEGGSLQELMTTSQGYVNDRLAPLYGVPAPGSDELQLIELDPSQRTGILTQPGILASTSHGLGHSPIFRGLFVLERFLCAAPPAAPAGVLDEFQMMDQTSRDEMTTRQYFEQTHNKPTCAGCHNLIDGMGYTFEHYDALGRFRTMEANQAIDATGELINTGEETDGPVENALQMSTRLADSERMRACYITHWLRYSLGRKEDTADRCQIHQLGEHMQQNDGDLKSLVIALVTSPTFRSKPAAQ